MAIMRKEVAAQPMLQCTFPNCGKFFPDKASLKKHMKSHGVKRFVCPVEGCGKRFLDKSKLKRHLLVHTVREQALISNIEI